MWNGNTLEWNVSGAYSLICEILSPVLHITLSQLHIKQPYQGRHWHLLCWHKLWIKWNWCPLSYIYEDGPFSEVFCLWRIYDCKLFQNKKSGNKFFFVTLPSKGIDFTSCCYFCYSIKTIAKSGFHWGSSNYQYLHRENIRMLVRKAVFLLRSPKDIIYRTLHNIWMFVGSILLVF